MRGAYCVVGFVAGHGLFAFRDPYGIKPIVVGRRDDGRARPGPSPRRAWCSRRSATSRCRPSRRARRCSSTSRAGCTRARSPSRTTTRASSSSCTSRGPTRHLEGISVYQARLRMGERLAGACATRVSTPDVVIPVPDSGAPRRWRWRTSSGCRTARAWSRTATSGARSSCPATASAGRSIRHKLNAIEEEFRGKRVLLVDDSIVRGNTSRQIVEMARAAGARQGLLRLDRHRRSSTPASTAST